MPKRKRTTIKRQIERTPEVKERERVWAKKIRKRLKLIELPSAKFKVYVGADELVKVFPKSDFLIHQHLPERNIFGELQEGRVLPSKGDIRALWELEKVGKAKTGVVAVMNKKGEVMGCTIYKIEKKDRPRVPGAYGIILEDFKPEQNTFPCQATNLIKINSDT